MSGTEAGPAVRAERGRQLPCGRCGAMLEYVPGTNMLRCVHCGGETPIVEPASAIVEHDYAAAIGEAAEAPETMVVRSMTCRSCGATTELLPEVAAANCPYCGSHFNVTAETIRVIKPHAVLPFAISRDAVERSLRTWLQSLWFAPNALRREAERERRVDGLYLPYWTYDAATTTAYQGWRGDHYTVTVGHGKNRRTEVRTRWRPASGTVRRGFDDVVVSASTSGLNTLAEKLGTWDLRSLVVYDDRYVAGFLAEAYRIDVAAGFDLAKSIMASVIDGDIRSDIGGDAQRIDSRRTGYERVTFKHILLPLWVGSFRYRSKIYRFLVNGRSGNVSGERPWSWVKITLAVVAGVAVVGTVVVLFANR